jgi:outer membrane protein OmpA-like peptidoglycan-associated protein
MKNTGLIFLALALAAMGQAQPPSSAPPAQKLQRAANLDIGNAPTAYDMYCAGFITTDKVPDNRYLAAGVASPDQTRYAASNAPIFIHGRDIKEGDRFEIVRKVKDPNRFELYRGQYGAIREAGQPYFELGYVKVVEVQKETGIAVPELSCAEMVPGDLAIPFETREAPIFKKVALERFAPPNGKTVGRIIMANEFDKIVGSKHKVYLSVGADKGLKVGDYLRATRTYSATYADPDAGLSLKASANEDTQLNPQKLPRGEVSGLPRLTLGDMMVLQVHRKSATAMVLTALQDIHVGDGVELMDVTAAPEIQPVLPVSAGGPGAETAAPPADTSKASPPTITCTASPTTVRVGESSRINCNAASPDNRPLSITFVANGGRLSSSRNQATLDTSDAGAGPIQVRATAFDDRQLSASSVTTVNVEAATPAVPSAQKLSELDFKPNSAYVDNRSKAILDDVALKMEQDPAGNVMLSGSSEELEPPRLATQRAENAKTYLTKSKGIDGQRIQTKTGGTGRKVEVWTVPAGAAAPATPPEPPK